MRFTRRSLTGAVIGALIVVCVYVMVRVYVSREIRRWQITYYGNEARGWHEVDMRFRGEIEKLRKAGVGTQMAAEITDQLFDSLRFTPPANMSREVDRWRRSPPSPERTKVALKWAATASEHAAYMAELNAHWLSDSQMGVSPHHITGAEVKQFRMPEGWNESDLMEPGEQRNP